MKKNQLGKTGLEVTQLAIGTLTMSPMQRGLNAEEGAAVILHALDSGINFIDTAQMYGSYEQVALALKRWQGPAPILASKSAAKSYESMRQAVSECRASLHKEQIDVFLLHAVRDAQDLNERQGALQALVEARAAGKIRAIGASSHSARTIQLLAENELIEVLHPMLNRDGIGILDADRDEMMQILVAAREKGIGIYAMKPLGGGHLRGDAVRALKWLFEQNIVDAAAVGMTTFAEIDMNVAIAENQEVDRSFAEKVAGQPRRLFINAMICRNCGACVEACQQGALQPGEKSPQINHQRCVLCGYCAPACPGFAIRII